MANPIVVVGSSNTDMVIKLDRIPRPSETVIGGDFSTSSGGKGANQAVAAARAGGSVALVAKVGQDMFGVQAVHGFVKDGIDVRFVFKDNVTPSGVALIFVDKHGENCIAVASGANAHLSPADIETARAVITAAKLVVLQLETPVDTIKAAAIMAATNGARVILNPAPAQSLDDDLLKHVSILTPNETEAEILTGIKADTDATVAQAAQALLARGVQTVILTLGARGAFVATATTSFLSPGFKVTAVDSTAAGDIFNGALAVALAEDTPMAEAVRFANAAAAISVTKMGAQLSIPHRNEINRFIKAQG